MADFVLSAPGTTNDPWTPPASVIVLGSTLKSDATGFRAHATTVVAFAHNVNYGPVITSTVTLATTGLGADAAFVGALVRSGANAGNVVGVFVNLTTCFIGYGNLSDVQTNIGGSVGITRAANDVWSCTITNSGGVLTIVPKQNGTTIGGFGSNQTTQFVNEASLAAGAQLIPDNSNTLYLSQFTGTGVLVPVTPAFPSLIFINP